MSLAEKIVEHLRRLPEEAQAEVLDFVELLETRSKKSRKDPEDAWSSFSLAQAMRGMEDEEEIYSLEDLREAF